MELVAENSTGIAFLTADKYHLHRHIALQLMILLITIGVFFDTPDTVNLSFNRFCGWVTYYLFMNMLAYTNVYLLFPKYMAKDKILQYVIAVLLFTSFSLILLVILQELFYDIAVSHQEPSPTAISLSIVSSFLAIILFMVGMSALLLFKPLMQSYFRENELKILASESELKFLKSQINPHFLFNTINNANILLDDEPSMASSILTKLDDLLTYQWNDSHKDQVYLRNDIQLLSDYLDLEKIRRDQFDFNIDTYGAFDFITIPPLLFIPFVENAVKHNLDSNGASYVKLVFKLENGLLIFTCQNSTPSFSKPSIHGGIGLQNVVRRLDMLYDDRYILEKEEKDQTYTVKLTLKL